MKSIVKTHAIGHVLVLGIAEFTVELLLLLALLHEQDEIRIVWLLDDAREVHGIVNLILSLQHFFKTEVIMAFLQGVERYIFVVLGEYVTLSVGTATVRSVSAILLCVRLRASCNQRWLGLSGLDAETVFQSQLVVPGVAALSHASSLFYILIF